MQKQRRGVRNQRGFTLIEVALFLAVSSMLVIIALSGFGGSFRNIRFSTGVRDIQETIASQLSAASLGENRKNRPGCSLDSTGRVVFSETTTIRGTNQDCVIIGRVITVARDKLYYFDVAARRTPFPGMTNCTGLEGIIRCYRPVTFYFVLNGTRFANSNGEYVYKHGIQTPVRRVGDDRDFFDYLAFGVIQDPNSTERHRFFYNGNFADFTFRNIDSTEGSAGLADVKASRGGMTCLVLSGRKAALQFDITKDEPELIFEDSRC